MSVRRAVLRNIPFHPQFFPNAGLWFDKYLKVQKGATLEPYADHITLTGKIKEPSAYEAFFNRWQAQLKTMGAQMVKAKVIGRIAAGLGGASVIENGLTFHHTYGVPIIPGSSLKGTARAYAAANLDGVWAEKGPAFRTLFGGQALTPHEDDSEADKQRKKARAGIVVFYDALPLPHSFGIHNEVMTVHHREYYQTGKQPPADWDSPTPIPFLSAHGTFLIALYAPDAPQWAASGMGILKMALEEIGVGGKTSSGYGRMTSIDDEKSQDEENEDSSQETPSRITPKPLSAEEKAVKTFKDKLSHTDRQEILNEWRTSSLPERYRQEMARLYLRYVRGTSNSKQWKRTKRSNWYRELIDSLPTDDDTRNL
ncbi:MAG: type III-B CRISPR module RAMP protein Cmr6 [Anaerolineales bacterium]|nr:type III-B CRISPR module RAMP protein Cmr6 [Anaerolineales bacterium]